MTNRIMLRAYANENTVSIQTYTPRMKSPQRFYITYSELDRLQGEGSSITNDIHSFVKLRLDEHRDRLTFEFTWLSGRGFDRVEGVEQPSTSAGASSGTFWTRHANPTARRKTRFSAPFPWTHAGAAPGSYLTATGPISAPPLAIRGSGTSWARPSWPTSTGPTRTKSTSPTTSCRIRSFSGNTGTARPVCAAG